MEDIIDFEDFGKKKVRFATATLVLGILSIVFSFLYGIPGFILGIIGISISGHHKAKYKKNPEHFDLSSYKKLQAGFVCSLIGLILSFLIFIVIFAIAYFVVRHLNH